MKVNGLELPPGFVRDLKSRRLRRDCGSWPLRKNFNAFGDPLETELGYTFQTKAEIQKETDKLAEGFVCISPEEITETCKILGVQAGEIPYFWDFSKIICFGIAGDGAPFCFDFRENESKPRVIWWADAFWQRVAPSYPAFIRLFKIPTAKRKAK